MVRVIGALALAFATLTVADGAMAACVPGTTVHGKCTQEPPPPPPPPPHG
jgi:hypothetical protein